MCTSRWRVICPGPSTSAIRSRKRKTNFATATTKTKPSSANNLALWARRKVVISKSGAYTANNNANAPTRSSRSTCIGCLNLVTWRLIMPCPTHAASMRARTTKCWSSQKRIATRVIARHLNIWVARRKLPVGASSSHSSNPTKLIVSPNAADSCVKILVKRKRRSFANATLTIRAISASFSRTTSSAI